MLVILYLSMDDGEIVAERIKESCSENAIQDIIMGFDPSLVGEIGTHA